MRNLFILIFMVSILVSLPSVAVVNRPGAPTFDSPRASTSTPSSYYKKNYSTNSYASNKTIETPKITSGDSTKDKLDEISKKILKAAENRQNAELNKYYKEMMSYGVKEIYPPAVYAKKTPQCPPVEIELNGKILKGSLCAQFGYVYKGKSYHHGYCR